MSISHLSLFKRSNGYWYILYTENGRQRWKSTGERFKEKALKALTEFRLLTKKKAKARTVQEFAQEFLKFAEASFSPGTVAIYRTVLRKLEVIAGRLNLDQVSALHWDTYKADRTMTVSPVTANIELRTLRAVMSTAVRWQYLEQNPFTGLRMVPVPQVAPAYFTKEDFERLISVIKEHWLREVVVFATVTGLRRGEIVNLKWQDVDLSRKVVSIQGSPTFKTKSGKRRVTPLNETAFYILSSRFGKDPSEYVFTLNGGIIYDDWLTNLFRRYVRKAKLSSRLHFHSLRHSFATWLAQSGISIYQISKLLGHSDVKTTQTFYAHLQPETMHSEVSKIELPWKN